MIDSIQVFIPISRIAMTKRQSNKQSYVPMIPIKILDERLSSDVISYYDATRRSQRHQAIPTDHNRFSWNINRL